MFEIFVPLNAPLSDQPFLELVYAMLLTAIGSAVIFYCEASSGGTDIVALVLKKFTSFDVGKALLCSDFVIAASSFIVFDIKTGLFSSVSNPDSLIWRTKKEIALSAVSADTGKHQRQ